MLRQFRQFYICWEDKRETELFQYVCEECGMEICPMVKTDRKESNAFELFCCVFVPKREKHLVRYRTVRDEQGKPYKVLYPFDRRGNFIPYIEYAQEFEEEKYIVRIWRPTYDPGTVEKEQMKLVFKSIKKWAVENCKKKEKMDGIIWVYTI